VGVVERDLYLHPQPLPDGVGLRLVGKVKMVTTALMISLKTPVTRMIFWWHLLRARKYPLFKSNQPFLEYSLRNWVKTTEHRKNFFLSEGNYSWLRFAQICKNQFVKMLLKD
jgi:hypothetical protein